MFKIAPSSPSIEHRCLEHGIEHAIVVPIGMCCN